MSLAVETAVTQLLLGDATLSGLIQGRLCPQDAPQDVQAPYVVYTTSDPELLPTMTGYLAAGNTSFRFDCWGGGGGPYTSAKAVARAVRNKLFGLTFPYTTTFGGESLVIECVSDEGGEDGLEPPVHADEQGFDYCGVQVRVHHAEP